MALIFGTETLEEARARASERFRMIAQAVEESRREENIAAAMRRFREVERDVRPTFAKPTITPIPPPPTLSQQVQQSLEAGRSPILDVAAEDIIRQRERGSGAGRLLEDVERFSTRFLDPIAAAGLQVAESPAGGGFPGVTGLKGVQRQLEDVGVPEEFSPLPRERTFGEAFEGGFVNPFAAIAGNKEEQEKAQAVLEEAGLPRALAAQIIFDPLNVLPIVGFTRVDDVARLGRLVIRGVRAAPRARGAAVRTLRESDNFQRLLRTVGEEAGGRPPTGPLRGGEAAPPNLLDDTVAISADVPDNVTFPRDAGKIIDTSLSPELDDAVVRVSGRGGKPPGEPPTGIAGAGFDPDAERNLRVALAQTQDVKRLTPLDNVLKPVNRVVNIAKTRNPEIQAVGDAVANYSEADAVRGAAWMSDQLKQGKKLFGRDVLEGRNLKKFGAKYTGSSTAPEVGSFPHIIEHPADYSLSLKQRQFLSQHDNFLREDIRFSREVVGVDVGEVFENYVRHAVREDQIGSLTARGDVLVSRAKLPFQKGRSLGDIEEYAAVLREAGFEPELNYEKLLRQRLYSGVRARAEAIFVDKTKRFSVSGIGSESVGNPKYGNLRFGAEDAEDIRSLINPARETDPTGRVLQTAIEAGREVLLNFDLSGAFGIQGLQFFAAQGPLGVLRRAPRIVQFLFSPEGFRTWFTMNADDLQLFTLHGGRIYTQPFELAGGGPLGARKLVLERVPGLGKVAKELNAAQFERLTTYYKFETWKSYVDMLRGIRDHKGLNFFRRIPGISKALRKMGGIEGATDDVIMSSSAEAVNNIFGGLRVEKVGVSGWQKVLLLTPQWLRANIGNIVTVAKRGDPQGIIARRFLVQQLVMAGTLASGVTYLATGNLPGEKGGPNLFDNTKSDWLSINAGRFKVPLIPGRVYLRTLARLLNPPEGISREQSLATFASGRSGQFIGVGTELLTGKDYLGRDIGNKFGHIAKSALPIVGQQAVEQFGVPGVTKPTEREEGAAVTAARIGLEGAGFTTVPRTARQDLIQRYDEEVAKGTFGPDALSYREEAREIRKDNIRSLEELSGLQTEAAEASAERGSDFEQRSNEINDQTEFGTEAAVPSWNGVAERVLANAPGSHAAYVKIRGDSLQERVLKKEAIAETLGIDFGEDRESEVRLSTYRSLQPTDRNGNGFIDDTDMRAFFDERDQLFSQLTEREKEVVKNPGKYLRDETTIEAEQLYLDAVETRDDYFDIPKYQGLKGSREEQVRKSEEIDEVKDSIQEEARRISAQTGTPLEDTQRLWRQRLLLLPLWMRQWVQKFILTRTRVISGKRGKKGGIIFPAAPDQSNPERFDFRQRHPELIDWFPDLFGESRELAAALGEASPALAGVR